MTILHKNKIACFSLLSTFFINCMTVNPLTANLNWSSPVNLSQAGQNAIGAQVSVDENGSATAVWSRYNGSNYIVQGSTSVLGSIWTKPLDLSHRDQDAFFASVSKDNLGGGTAVWARTTGTNTIIQAALKHPKKGWFPADNLSQKGPAKNNATAPQIAYDLNGNAIAIWQKFNGINNIIQTAAKSQGGEWSKSQNITIANANGLGDIQPQLAIDSSGNAIAIWTNHSTSTIRSAFKNYKEAWSAPLDISMPGSAIGQPQIVFDQKGNATAVWTSTDGLNCIVQAATRSAKGAWSVPVTLSLAGGDALTPDLAVDPSGNVVAVWQRSNGSFTVVQSSRKPFGGAWQAALDLSDATQDASEPQVRACVNGNIIVVWKRSDGENFVIQAIVKPVKQNWTVPVSLSAPGQDAVCPQLAVDIFGNAIVVWQRSNGSNTIVQSSFGSNNLKSIR